MVCDDDGVAKMRALRNLERQCQSTKTDGHFW